MRHGEASSSGEPPHAFSRKEPKVLRRGRCHETPFFSGGSRENGAEITRRNNDDPPRIDVAAAKCKRLPRIRQVLYDIEHDDDVNVSDFPQRLLIRFSLEDMQSRIAGMISRLRSQFEPNDIEMATRFRQEKPVGTSNFQQPSAAPVAANEVDAARKFPPQHFLAAEIIRISIGMAAAKVVFGIIERRIKSVCVRAAGPAQAALKDAPAVNMESEVVLGDRAAGAT